MTDFPEEAWEECEEALLVASLIVESVLVSQVLERWAAASSAAAFIRFSSELVVCSFPARSYKKSEKNAVIKNKHKNFEFLRHCGPPPLPAPSSS